MINDVFVGMNRYRLVEYLPQYDTLAFLVMALVGLLIINTIQLCAVRIITNAEKSASLRSMIDIEAMILIIASSVGISIWFYVGLAWMRLDETWYAYALFIGLVQFGGVIYRIRGGWLGHLIPGGTTPARIIWMTYVTSLMLWLLLEMTPTLIEANLQRILTPADYVAYSIATATLCYVFMLIPHGRQHDLGAVSHTFAEDAWHLTCIGSMRVLAIVSPLALFDNTILWVVWIGILHPVCYAVGWRSAIPQYWIHGNMRYPIDGETAWGEFFWGQCQTYTIVGGVGLAGYSVGLFGTSLF